MDSSVVGIRSKALRALSSIVTVDPDVLTLVSLQARSGVADGISRMSNKL